MARPLKIPQPERRAVTILGSTGSIGRNTIDLIERNPGAYRVEALTASNQVDDLADQAIRIGARLAVIRDETKYARLRERLAGTPVKAAAGADAIVEAADRPADWVMAAIVGAAGLQPTLTAARRGAVVALANKECLVCAGPLLLNEVERSGATLLPVDSEHSAIFQVYDFQQADRVERIILTASGGPFLKLSRAAMREVTPQQAVAHPNWNMGAKISVDSATMMNKGLELIEAHFLFGQPADKLEVLIHPQSIVHSLVAYIDGSVLAQLGTPDMRTPIAFALGWPQRMEAPSPRLDLARIGNLTFEEPDTEQFPALGLARQALKSGGGAPTVLNAANEVAVQGFLDGRIGFLEISEVVCYALEHAPCRPPVSVEDVVDIDASARCTAEEAMSASVFGR